MHTPSVFLPNFLLMLSGAPWWQDRRKRQRREGQRKEVATYKEAVLDVIVTAKDRYGGHALLPFEQAPLTLGR